MLQRVIKIRHAFRKIFRKLKRDRTPVFIIDCGGWKADSVQKLRKLFDPECKYLMHTFEPNSAYAPFYKDLKNHILHTQAVWIYDGEINLFLEKQIPNQQYSDEQADSLLFQKINVDAQKSIKVPCVDFSKWILSNFMKSDYIILKMDIEGAEYAVLKKMINEGSIKYITEFSSVPLLVE
ncbi:MAG: FkbM family methyltransferase [Candidatus Omnitrophica bacterium]|nr:FkbM family methyltransferase [Candidatus Omnitrophota bacterium]